MLICLFVSVIFFNNTIKKFLEFGVRIMGTGVATNARVKILNTREDAGLEGNARSISLVFVLFPNLLGQILRHKRFGSSGEETLPILQLRSIGEILGFGGLLFLGGCCFGRSLLWLLLGRGSLLSWCRLLLLLHLSGGWLGSRCSLCHHRLTLASRLFCNLSRCLEHMNVLSRVGGLSNTSASFS